MKILSTENHYTTSSKTSTKAPEDAETNKNLRKVVQSDYIYAYTFFFTQLMVSMTKANTTGTC